MSELSTCNYCRLKLLRGLANSDGNILVIRKFPRESGIYIYVFPPGVKMPNRVQTPTEELPDGDEFHKKYQKVWFETITDKCCC